MDDNGRRFPGLALGESGLQGRTFFVARSRRERGPGGILRNKNDGVVSLGAVGYSDEIRGRLGAVSCLEKDVSMRVSTIALLCLLPMVVFGATGQYRLSWRSDPAIPTAQILSSTSPYA